MRVQTRSSRWKLKAPTLDPQQQLLLLMLLLLLLLLLLLPPPPRHPRRFCKYT